MISARTRRFAKWSAICSFALEMAGQVAYQLIAPAGMTRAPWAITTVVFCLPVLVLATGTALAHSCARTPRPLMHQAAGPDRRPCCGPCPGSRRTTPDRAADGGRPTGPGQQAGTSLIPRRHHIATAGSRGLAGHTQTPVCRS
jgi:hypothetical protein